MVNNKTFDKYLMRLNDERRKYKKLKHLRLLDEEIAGCYGYDIGKLVFLTMGTTISGVDLVCRLREEYHLELEMGGASYAIAMTSVCDSDEGWERLRQAIFAIDQELSSKVFGRRNSKYEQEASDTVMTIRDAMDSKKVTVSLNEIKSNIIKCISDSVTQPIEKPVSPMISATYIMCYPPGIPLLVPGERINMEVLTKIEEAVNAGCEVLGMNEGEIAVVAQEIG